ncbi:MAG TPA: class I SAM-dependent methyltransferase [Anaerolineales bacterium]|nr:class I SAM-dependent methyltransferase [Anaerolineales bacterium]
MPPVNYNEISKNYDDVREGDILLINHFLQEISSDDALTILDIGCGTGNYTDLFQRVTQEKQYQVHGIEPSEGMIDKARTKNSHIIFKQATADSIPFDDHFFNFVYMTDVIHHIPDIRRMFSEIQRILKPRGKVCIVTQSHRQVEARPIAQFFPGTVRVDKQRYPDIDRIIAAAQFAGLTYQKQEILFEGEAMAVGADFLELVRKKGYSMLHLLTEQEYQTGLSKLEDALQNGHIQAQAAGETLVWFTRG